MKMKKSNTEDRLRRGVGETEEAETKDQSLVSTWLDTANEYD